MGCDRCPVGWLASSRMSGVIVMSHNDPHQAGGDPSKTRPSVPARLAVTRQNDAFYLVISHPFNLTKSPPVKWARR